MAMARSKSVPRAVQQCCLDQGQDTKYSDGNCPICKPLPVRKRPEEPRDFKHMLSLVHETISDVKLQRSASKARLARKASKGHLQQSKSVDSLKLPPSKMAEGNQYALFPRSDSQLPPMRYQISRSPGERAKLVLVNELSGPEARPQYKEVARGRGILKGHRQERSDILPLRHFENPRPSPANYENPRPPPSNPRQRSLVAQEVHTRFRDNFDSSPGEILQATSYVPTLQPVSYEPPRTTPAVEPSERLGPRIMARKNSREEVPLAVRKNSREDVPEPLKVAPRLQLTPVPEIRDESIMERGRPVSRRDSQRGRNNDGAPGGLSPRSKSAAPAYTLPQTRYSPSKPPSISRISPQPSPWEPEPMRKDSMDPMCFRSDGPFRVVRALREIDKSCMRLFDECDALQTERRHLHSEMTSVINDKNFDMGHLSILRQQQQDLVDLDAKIDRCMHDIMERQRRKTALVDGLPEIQEMDTAEELKETMAKREAENTTPATPWGPREDSLAASVQADGLLSPPPPLRVQQRGTVTYAEIMDFLDEFD